MLKAKATAMMPDETTVIAAIGIASLPFFFVLMVGTGSHVVRPSRARQ